MRADILDFLSPAQRALAMEGFWASVTALPLAAGGAAGPTFTIGDSDFLLTKITGAARDPAAPSNLFVAPAITIDIRDQGAGRNLFDRPQDWVAIVGDGRESEDLPVPYMVQQNSVVTVNLANLDPAQAYNARLSFWGVKIFPYERSTG
jgi:hypothetical protein